MSIVVLVLLACGDKDGGGGDGGGGDDSGTPGTDDSAPPIDADKDGVTEAEDCDDGDSSVHPGAKEECNEKDDDCDNETDEGVQVTSYGDDDADGYGDDAVAEQGCWVPHGNAEVGGDCDDQNDDVHPDADEVCDDLDNDCDLLVDDDDVLDDGDDWYLDEDGDGYGGEKGILTCTDPGEGWDNVSTDCDDANPDVFPGAEEVCGDGVLQNCSRSSGEAFADCNGASVDASQADVTASVGGGAQTIAFADLTGDGITDVVIGMTDFGDVQSGAFIFPGPLTGDLDSHDATFAGAPTGENPLGIVGVGDADGDAQDDLLVGTPLDGQAADEAGAAYVVSGPITDDADLVDADLVVFGDGSDERIGSTVQLLADWTGDGVNELLVAAGGAEGGVGSGGGAVWVLEGGASGERTTNDLAFTEIRGSDDDQLFGAGIANGDLTGDGVSDVVVGNGGNDEQVVYVFVGSVAGVLTDGDADFEVRGDTTDSGFGLAPAITDLDGDGAGDLVVGAYGAAAPAGGRVLAWNGPFTKSVDDSSAVLTIEGDAGDHLGGSVDATDIDGDGAMDLVVQGGVYWSVGSGGVSTDHNVAGWVFFGPLDGTTSAGSSDLVIDDPLAVRFVRVAPDVDDDGRLEVAWDTSESMTYFVNLDGY